jgi:hypothetical protein
MACLINAGITRDCGFAFGGLQKIYLANKADVSTVAHDSGTNEITGITMTTGATFYEYEFEPETGQALQELQAGSISRFVLQTLNLSLAGMTQSKKDVLEDMANADMVAIYQKQDDVYFYYGELGRGLRAATLTVDSGTADADSDLVQISLAGGNRGYADTVDSTIIAGLL